MKLSELVLLKQRIERVYNVKPVLDSIDSLQTALRTIPHGFEEEYGNEIGDILDSYTQIKASVQVPDQKLQDVIARLDHDISEKSQIFFAENYELELVYNSIEKLRTVRVMVMPDHIQQRVEGRISAHTTWLYPALEIGCRDGEWTKFLIASDPLYLTDAHQEFLDSAVKDYPPEYQRRVRSYLVDNDDYSILPKNQFNFIFSWNNFNYKSLDTLKQTLKQIYTLLRPGGVFMFSYNNGDLPAGAAYAENYFMSYMPKSLVIPMCQMLGFEIVYSEDHEPAFSWIEIRKPGELKTSKAHQVMGEIKELQII